MKKQLQVSFSLLLRNILFLTFFFSIVNAAFAGDQSSKNVQPGITEKLGSIISLDTQLNDENNSPVTLKQLIDKPTIVLFVYYECPSLCNPLMVEVASQIDRIDLTPGKDYKLVCISIDDAETAANAARKKKNILEAMQKEVPHSAWRFLTGSKENVSKVAASAGFFYKKEGTLITHASALIVVSPQGKITRYLMGTTSLPFDIKMAVLEASEGKVTPTIAKILKFCFNYDPQGRKYVLNITRIAGGGILLLAIIFVIVLSVKPRKTAKS